MSVQTPAGGFDLGTGAGLTLAETVTAAETVLSGRFGATVQLADPQDLGGGPHSSVLRVRVAASPFSLPRTLVVKRHTGLGGASADRFAREAVSYQLFNALAEEDRMCPELVAHDGRARVLVLEDLGDEPTLADKLLGEDSRAAEQALVSFARSLGRLHATTASREADFDALMRRFNARPPVDSLTVDCLTAVEGVPALLAAALGVSTAEELGAAITRACRLLHRGRHRAFSTAALCPDNNLITGKGVRFVDFKGGCVREVLLDAAYLRVPFPSCWCTFALPAGMSEAMVAAWRAEAAKVWPELADDAVLMPRLLDAQLLWVWLSTWRLLPRQHEKDRVTDTGQPAPRRSELLLGRWQRLAAEAELLHEDMVAEHAAAVADGLLARFGRELEPRPYPAFSGSVG